MGSWQYDPNAVKNNPFTPEGFQTVWENWGEALGHAPNQPYNPPPPQQTEGGNYWNNPSDIPQIGASNNINLPIIGNIPIAFLILVGGILLISRR